MYKQNFATNYKFSTCISSLIIILSGCAHPLVIKNIGEYRVSSSSVIGTDKRIGIKSQYNNDNEQIIIEGIADNMRRYSGKVVYPYTESSAIAVDVIADIELQSKYKGSTANFFITWPGFLIWTPAWNGYVYKIDHNFKIRLEDGSSNSKMGSFSVPVSLDIRHSAMNRTWIAETGGWLLPGYSAVALIGGIFHMEYDNNVTPIAAREISEPVGRYIAQKIVHHITNDSENIREYISGDSITVDQNYPQYESTVAILTFDARQGISSDEALLLTDRFAAELDRTRAYQLVPRSRMKEIMEFQAYSLACSSVECAVEAGQHLGVEYMIYGSIGRIGSMYTINVYIAGVEQATVVAGATADYDGRIEKLLTEGMSDAVDKLMQAVRRKVK